jgi:hypothetical protein
MSGWPSRARRAITRMRSQRPQRRRGRGAQRAHNGRPSASRPATGLITLQVWQGWAVWRRRQLGQRAPCSVQVSFRSVRPHVPQHGTGNVVEPRMRSAVTRRVTVPGAPTCKTSMPWVVTASDRLSNDLALLTVASKAAVTCSTSRDASAVMTAANRASRRQVGQDVAPSRRACPCAHGVPQRRRVTRRRSVPAAGWADQQPPAPVASARPGKARSARRGCTRGCRTARPGRAG